MRWQIGGTFIDFGPLSIVSQGDYVARFHYSETERKVIIDLLYEYAAYDYDATYETNAVVCDDYDAPWRVEIDSTLGLNFLGLNDNRRLSLLISHTEAGNLANALSQDLIFSPDEYQRLTKTTAKYYDKDLPPIAYLGLGLAGEAGEITNKLKKLWRDDQGQLTDESIQSLQEEVGDILWYCARLLDDLGVSLEETMYSNLSKLRGRAARGTLHGSGDTR